MFQLIHTTRDEFLSFQEALRRASFGDTITLYQGPINNWMPHEDGVICNREADDWDLFFNHETHPVSKVEWDQYCAYGSKTVMLKTDDGLVHNGKIMYAGKLNRWETNQRNRFFVEWEKRVFADGKHELCQIGANQIWKPWPGHDDIVVRHKDALLCNGKPGDIFYQGPMEGYTLCSRGPIISDDKDRFLFGREVIWDKPHVSSQGSIHGLIVEEDHEDGCQLTLIVIK